MTGRIVGNRYKIGDRLGGGGMAVVYQAQDMQLGREVAVKILRGQFGQDEDFIRRFRREAQNAASLSHPNVVQIYDVGQDEDLYYIVLELVEGRSLKEVIQQQGPLPVAEAARIAAEILSALAHAHQHRIVHRDVKPHNILISRDGRVKVTDFGIARATTTDTVTHTGSIMGSAHYFSPEQADGRPVGDKSDIYSMGVVLYEMVTGTVPFQGESPITVAIKHLRDPVMPPSRLNSELPVELEEIIMRALEKEPEDRFESANAMRDALRSFAEAHAAGRTHMPSGDFPTMDLRSMRTQKFRRETMQPDENEEDESAIPVRLRAARERDRERSRRSSGWIWVIVIALVVFGGVGAASWAVLDYLNVPDVEVPDVRGLSRKDAETLLRNAKLNYFTQSEQFSDLKMGSVINTDPPPTTPVKQNRDIGLIISKGPETVKMPDVRNRTLEDARAALESLRLVVGTVDYKIDPTVEAGKVISTTPVAGIDLKPDATVNLLVSSGPLQVPDLIGKSAAEAKKALEALGLVMVPEYKPHPTLPKDRVMQTDPPAPNRVTPGQAVKVILSQGTTAEGKPFEKELTVACPQGQLFCDFKVVVVSTVGGVPTPSDPLINERKQHGEKVTVRGTFFGEAYLSVVVNNAEVIKVPLP